VLEVVEGELFAAGGRHPRALPAARGFAATEVHEVVVVTHLRVKITCEAEEHQGDHYD